MKFKDLPAGCRFRLAGSNLYEFEKVDSGCAMIARIVYDGPETVKAVLGQLGTMQDIEPGVEVVRVATA